MEKIKKSKELKLREPLFSAYHFQGTATATILENPTIENWYLNNAVILTCERKFLDGFTTPDIRIKHSSFHDCPCYDITWVTGRFLEKGFIKLVKNCIDQGYFVGYNNIDDYYVAGKTFYKKRHFAHDGLITGYDENDKTFTIYAYDSTWKYRPFKTPQAGLEKGRRSALKENKYTNFMVFKPKSEIIEFSAKTALLNIREYLNSNLRIYKKSERGTVYGTAVHKYLEMYLKKLIDSSIPYNRSDWRIMRVVWEHKKAMLKRIKLIEDELKLNNSLSDSYMQAVRLSDKARILYASYETKQRNDLLIKIISLIEEMDKIEKCTLKKLIRKAEKNEII